MTGKLPLWLSHVISKNISRLTLFSSPKPRLLPLHFSPHLTLFSSPKPRLLIAWVFHSGNGGWKESAWAFSTPRGTDTITASPRKILAQPVCVERACTSTPVGVLGWNTWDSIIMQCLVTYRQCCNAQQWPLCSDECLVPWTVPVEAGHTHHAGLGGTLVREREDTQLH